MNITDLVGLNTTGFVSMGTAGILLLVLLLVWTFVWKGIALWKSARKNSLVWFIVLLIVNTFGILEILYIFVFSKLSQQKKSPPARARRRR